MLTRISASMQQQQSVLVFPEIEDTVVTLKKGNGNKQLNRWLKLSVFLPTGSVGADPGNGPGPGNNSPGPPPPTWGSDRSVLPQKNEQAEHMHTMAPPASPHLPVTHLSRLLSHMTASLSQVPEGDGKKKKNAFSQAEQVICLSAHFVFLHKSCLSLFLLPLATERFLIIRKMVFSADRDQGIQVSWRVRQSQTFGDRAQKTSSDGGSNNNINYNKAQ